MIRLRFISVPLALTLALPLAACGGGGGGPDADATVRLALQAWSESNDVFTEEVLDTSCFQTASSDQVRTEEIMLQTKVTDFQTDAELPDTTVTAFDGIDHTNPWFTGTSDSMGNITVILPAGHTARFGFKMVEADSYDTFLLNQYVQPTGSPQTSPGTISAISFGTGAAIPALVGISRTDGTGVLAGALRDCQRHELSNFTAVVSSVSGQKVPLPNARPFYFQNGLPARNTVMPVANKDGLFAVLELPPAPTAFVQMWGYLTAADAASETETLLSEMSVPVIADNMVTGSYELQRN